MNQLARWILVFGGIFLLTQDYLFFFWPSQPSWLGLPEWLGWFIALHILLVIEFVRFQRKFWK